MLRRCITPHQFQRKCQANTSTWAPLAVPALPTLRSGSAAFPEVPGRPPNDAVQLIHHMQTAHRHTASPCEVEVRLVPAPVRLQPLPEQPLQLPRRAAALRRAPPRQAQPQPSHVAHGGAGGLVRQGAAAHVGVRAQEPGSNNE